MTNSGRQELGTASYYSAVRQSFADQLPKTEWRRDVAGHRAAVAAACARTQQEVTVGHSGPARERLKFTRQRIKSAPSLLPAPASVVPDSGDAPYVPTDEDKKLLADFTAEVRKRQVSSSENFDKSVLTLSTSGLAVSLAFLKDFIPIGNAICPWALYASWVLLTAATVSTMLSFLTSMRAQEFQQTVAEGYYLRKEDPTKKPNHWDRLVIWMNRASGASFIAGVLLTTLFVAINLQRAHEMKNLQQASSPVPEHRGLPSPSIVPSATAPAPPPPSAPAPAPQAK